MNFHKLVLIGFLFQVFDINIVIDIIPDFVGFIIIAYAFSKRQVCYATLGMYCSVILSIASFIEMFQGKTQTFFSYEAFNLWMEILAIVISLINILYLACIFYVSNQVVKIESNVFPTLFIGAQIVVQLLPSLWMHLPFGVLDWFILFMVLLFFCFIIYYFIFLWKRKNIENKMYEEMNAYDSQ